MKLIEEKCVSESKERIVYIKRRVSEYEELGRSLHAEGPIERANSLSSFPSFPSFEGGRLMEKQCAIETIAADINADNAVLIDAIGEIKNGGLVEKPFSSFGMIKSAASRRMQVLKNARLKESLLSIIYKLEKIAEAVMADAAAINDYMSRMKARREKLAAIIKEASEDMGFFSKLPEKIAENLQLYDDDGLSAAAAHKSIMALGNKEVYSSMITDWQDISRILETHISAYGLFLSKLAEIKNRFDSIVIKFKELFTAAAIFEDEFEKKLDMTDYGALMAEAKRASAALALNW